MKEKAEIEVTHLQAREHQGLPAASRNQKKDKQRQHEIKRERFELSLPKE